MKYIESFGEEDLLAVAADLRKRYNDARSEFYNDTRHYYHQSIASNYYTEEGLAKKLEKCKDLKRQYSEVKKILHDRGVRVDIGAWNHTNDDVFRTA